MKPIQFPEANTQLLAGSIPNCDDLAVYKDGERIISKWKMSWGERLSALFFGVAFVSVRARKTSPPIAVWVERQAFQFSLLDLPEPYWPSLFAGGGGVPRRRPARVTRPT